MKSKTEILAGIGQRVNLKTDTIEVPAWGGTVRLRGLTAAERDDYELASMTKSADGKFEPNMKNIRARLVARCVIDEQGDRVFTDSDADALAAEAASVIDPIFDKCQSLNGMSKKDIEELAKN